MRSRRNARSDRTSRGTSRRAGYTYRARDPNKQKQRAEGNLGRYYITEPLKWFRPKDGTNHIRILPPSEDWKNPEHYGLDVWTHYGVGADKNTVLCLQRMKNQACPICEEAENAEREGDEEYFKEISAKHRVLVFLVNRDAESEGVQAWDMPAALDQDIAKVSINRRTGETLELDNPDEGYDVFIDKSGAGKRTRYAPQVDRDPTDLGRDAEDWLDYINEKPIPELLRFNTYSELANMFNAKFEDNEEEEEEERPTRKRESKKKGYKKLEDLPIKFRDLCNVIEEENLAIDPDLSDDDEQLREWIATELNIL